MRHGDEALVVNRFEDLLKSQAKRPTKTRKTIAREVKYFRAHREHIHYEDRDRQQGLGRPEADCAVLIPIRKNTKWWALTQDERRQIFEEQSNHTQIGLEYLPAIARRLHHCRDLAEPEPFDFLTWYRMRSASSNRRQTGCRQIVP